MKALLFALLIAGSGGWAETVTRQEGLAAWERVYAIAAHPRCTNCHVGVQSEPMWNGLGYGLGTPHAMGIQAGESRIGAETIPCRTCHMTTARGNSVPHAAPGIDVPWQLPPVALAWLGRDSRSLCEMLRNPQRNGGHDIGELVDHLQSSAFVAWGFAPGAGRSKPPGSLAGLLRDVTLWGAAGSPCE